MSEDAEREAIIKALEKELAEAKKQVPEPVTEKWELLAKIDSLRALNRELVKGLEWASRTFFDDDYGANAYCCCGGDVRTGHRGSCLVFSVLAKVGGSKVSSCCGSTYHANVADEGTGCYVCDKCNKPCDEKAGGQ